MDKSNKMLIDATHAEETRVVVQRGGRVEEFDFESANRRLLRGNIYLAKVTRVEPSLQAAFVEYGGNRHGFLAFNEIHPDYYQIPIADRQALLQEEAEAEAAEEAATEAREQRNQGGRDRSFRDRRRGRRRGRGAGDQGDAQAQSEAQSEPNDGEHPREGSGEAEHPAMSAAMRAVAAISAQQSSDARYEPAEAPSDERSDSPSSVEEISGDEAGDAEAEHVEEVGSEDALEELPDRPRRRARQYKIQEVIKRRQVILVQVVKEERGNKGAALTSYLSLAGRYTVLMPNTGRGGGISRKITSAQDRQRLKEIATELEVPDGMGLIIRTAGASRSMQEIRRDYEYLLRLWENVREMALSSNAPALVYEEGSLIKRSIRDLYGKEVEEVVVAGDHAFAEARDFMRMMMPSHAKNVALYEGAEPLFARFNVERQLTALFSPYVTLRSGGYIVLNQTEALVSIDVNSGKSTREFSIEETALNTNLEAADEIARQLKLRDLAGLIVIDFIDMEEKRNNRSVERRLKDALRHDRARIQVGRISHFGLLEMSRQRLRAGMIEGSTSQCPHCMGTGVVRSTESVALAVLRGIEDHLTKDPRSSITVETSAAVAIYLLNQKRGFITEIEQRHGITIGITASERTQGANFAIERVAGAPAAAPRRPDRAAVNMDWGFSGADGQVNGESGGDGERSAPAADPDSEDDRYSRPRRRRGHRRGEGEEGRDGERQAASRGRDRPLRGDRPSYNGERGEDNDAPRQRNEELREEPIDAGGSSRGPRDDLPRQADDGEGEDGRGRRGRRRGRRGGRGRREAGPGGMHDGSPRGDLEGVERPGSPQPEIHSFVSHGESSYREPPRQREAPVTASIVEAERSPVHAEPPQADWSRPSAQAPEPRITEPRPAEPVRQPEPQAPRMEPIEVAPPPPEEPSQPARKGWWQRRFSS